MARTLERLHLLDSACPVLGWPLLRALSAADEPVAMLGSQRFGALAADRTPGLDLVACASAPVGSARSGALALRRELNRTDAEIGTVIAWSERARDVASHPLSGLRDVAMVSEELLSPPPPPTPEHSQTTTISRAELDLAEHETLLVALGGASGSVDAFAFAYLAGVLSLAGVPMVTLVPSSAVSLDRALRFVERHNHAWRSIVADYELPDVLGIADLAAYLPPQRPERVAERAAKQLQSELLWLHREGLAAVVRTNSALSEMLDRWGAASERVLRVDAGEPGLKTVRAVERALEMGKGDSEDRGAEFEAWAQRVLSIGNPTAQAV